MYDLCKYFTENPLKKVLDETLLQTLQGEIYKMKYYIVKKGRKKGIYFTWDDCKKQVDGFSGAIYKSFTSEKEAIAYMGSKQKDILRKKAKKKGYRSTKKKIKTNGNSLRRVKGNGKIYMAIGRA